MDLTAHQITREEATRLVPDLVALVAPGDMDWALYEKVHAVEVQARVGQQVIVAIKDWTNPAKTQFVRAKVCFVKQDHFKNEDGPVTRVKAGDTSWRVDGNHHFLPISTSRRPS